MTRRPLIAANWKLYKTVGEALEFVRALRTKADRFAEVDVVLAPPFTSLYALTQGLGNSGIQLAGQDVYWKNEGAFTGEISAPLLRDVGCSYAIVGHSERRHLFGETDEEVRRKVDAVLACELTPIVCIGETLEQRDSGKTEEVVLGQVGSATEGLSALQLRDIVFAYEPVWAIGTGRTASPDDAEQVHRAIRQKLALQTSEADADRVRILYGGSVKPGNAQALLAQPDIDGALVGGASLDAESFAAIIRAASNTE